MEERRCTEAQPSLCPRTLQSMQDCLRGRHATSQLYTRGVGALLSVCGEASAARRPSPALVWACGGLARHSAVRLLLAQWHGGVMVAWHGEPWPRRDLAALRGSRRRSPCSTVMHAGRRSPGPSPAQAPRSWAFTGLEAPQSLQPCVACGAPQSWALAGPGAVVLGRHRPGRRDLVALRGSRRRSPRGTALHAGRRSPGPSQAQAPWSGAFTGLDGPSPGRAPGHDLAGKDIEYSPVDTAFCFGDYTLLRTSRGG